GYWIRRRNFFWGKEIRHGNWQNDKVLRLFRRDKGRYPDVQVHEEIELPTPPGWCQEKLLHYSYRSLDDYLGKLSRYSAWGADDARRRGVHATGWKMWSHGCGRFFKSYFLKQGFRDGVEGLIIAFMEAYYGFFKYARLYEMQRGQR
ncbi:MAG: glycosyltransferase family 2 protein, partial [Limisphaerales bacterium]